MNRADVWQAINDYVRACGGDPTARVYGNTARQNAVVDIEAQIAFAESSMSDRELRLERELEERDDSLNLRWSADMRAIERWRAERPAERELTMPDHADLCVWLLEQLSTAESRLEEAELDAKLLGEQGATLHVKLKAAESRLDAATKLLRDLQEDLNMRAVNKVVPIGATMWNRLCDFLVERGSLIDERCVKCGRELLEPVERKPGTDGTICCGCALKD